MSFSIWCVASIAFVQKVLHLISLFLIFLPFLLELKVSVPRTMSISPCVPLLCQTKRQCHLRKAQSESISLEQSASVHTTTTLAFVIVGGSLFTVLVSAALQSEKVSSEGTTLGASVTLCVNPTRCHHLLQSHCDHKVKHLTSCQQNL